LKIVMVGEGAIARKHAAALARMDGAEITQLVGANPDDTAAFVTARLTRIAYAFAQAYG